MEEEEEEEAAAAAREYRGQLLLERNSLLVPCPQIREPPKAVTRPFLLADHSPSRAAGKCAVTGTPMRHIRLGSCLFSTP